MKIFMINGALCWWDATSTVRTLEEAQKMFSPQCVFVEAPDFVFEGWGYDPSEEGDAQFIQPTPPNGYEYNAKSGTFQEKNRKTEEQQLEESIAKMKAILAEEEKRLEAMKKGAEK